MVVLVRMEIVLYVMIVRVCYVGVLAMVYEGGIVDMVSALVWFLCVCTRVHATSTVYLYGRVLLLFSSSCTFRHLLQKFTRNPNSIAYEH